MKNKISITFSLFLLSITSLFCQNRITLEESFLQISTDIESSLSRTDGDRTLAVYYFTTNGERSGLGDFVTNELSSFLSSKLKDVSVLSRNKIDEIYEEHQFQLSGAVDSNAIADLGSKLSAEFIGTGYITITAEHIHLNFQLINVESAEIISGNSIDIIFDANLRGLSGMKEEVMISEIPEYQLNDSFTDFNRQLWTGMRKDEDINILVEDEHLSINVNDRKGVNGVNLISNDFKIRTFAMEISFRNPDEEAFWISLTVGNQNHENGASFQMEANIYDEYYLFRYKKKNTSTWVEDEDNIHDELFGDESRIFHTLKLVYDKTNKVAYGYVDDILVSKVVDFSFNSRDRGQVILSVNGRYKNIDVDFDDFKSSIEIPHD